jgi:hypothetical protein
MEIEGVPLIVAPRSVESLFVEQIRAALGGSTLRASAPNALSELLANCAQSDYLYLVIDEPLDEPLYDAIRYYLHYRDVLAESDPELEVRFASARIHSGHRLILVTDPDTLQSEPLDRQGLLAEMATVIAVRG